MKTILIIAAGGAPGAAARRFVNNQVTAWLGDGFPWGILTVNVVGCFTMGVLLGATELVWASSQEACTFLMVGFLGAFTTFSTFFLQVPLLYEQDQVALADLYVVLSVLLAVGGLFAGRAFAKSIAL